MSSGSWIRRHKLLAWSLFATVLLTVGISGAWVWRERRLQSTLLAAAAAAEQSEDWTAAESALRRYAKRFRDTAEVNRRIGQAIERGARDESERRRAFPFYAKAVSLAPNDITARLRFAELELDDNPQGALKSVEFVLRQDAAQNDALRIKALALLRLTAPTETSGTQLVTVFKALEAAVEQQPGNTRLVGQTAEFTQRHANRLAEALGQTPADLNQFATDCLDRLVTQADDEAQARLTRLLFRRRHGLAAAGDERTSDDLRRLVELSPASNLVRMLSAGWSISPLLTAVRSGESVQQDSPSWNATWSSVWSSAKQQIEAAMVNRPEDPVPYWSLAQWQWSTGASADALETLQKGRAVDSQNFVLALRTAEVQLALGMWPEAESTLRDLDKLVAAEANSATDSSAPAIPTETAAATAVAPSQSQPQWSNEFRPIVELLWTQWLLGPNNPAADAQQALGRLAPLADDVSNPGIRSLALFLRGRAQATLNRWEEALATFQFAAQIPGATVLPRLAAAHCMHQLSRYRDAATQYRQVLALLPTKSRTTVNVTQVWVELARCELAEQSRRAPWKREWRAFDEAMKQVSERLPTSPIPLFLDAEAARLSDSPERKELVAQRLADMEVTMADTPEFTRLRAIAHLRAGNPTDAKQWLDRWEQQGGQSDPEFRAELALSQDDWEAADQLWQAAARKSDETGQQKLLARRVQVALEKGRVQHALETLNEWLKTHPDDAAARFQVSQVVWSIGDAEALRKSAEALRKLEGDDARRPRIALTQSLLLSVAEQPTAEATQQLNQACGELARRFPNDRPCRVLEALAAELTGRKREATRAWRQAIALGEQDPNSLLRLASLLNDQGQPREALEFCLTARPTATDCRAACLATRILTAGPMEPDLVLRAEQLIQATLDAPPTRDRALLLMDLAVLREHQEKPEEAIQLTREALELEPDAVELQNNLAWFLASYHTKEHAAALELVDQAIAKVGELPQLLDTRAVALLAAGRPADAVKVLESCTKGPATSATRLLHLAEAYQQTRRLDDARRALLEAEKLGLGSLTPRDRRAYRKLKAQS